MGVGEIEMTPLRIKTIVHMDSEDRDRLNKLSKRTGAPLSELIRRAIAEYLKRQEKL
jgi:predicted DNA-binding protein